MLLWQAARHEAEQIRQVLTPGGKGLEGLVQIANMLGAKVMVTHLQDDVSGLVLKEERDMPEIFINALEPPQRQRFTLAHEIGHLVERANFANDEEYSFIDYRGKGEYTLHEFFADEFAGELLMPADEFHSVMETGGEYLAATHFGVSVPAVRKRRDRLKKNPA
ncbi:ImmA/IrrE family metallo-endopeptidase [Corynebacterium pyruviciproducens]|uniref:ImmA/IrrE family metallo-endopeptidase n=1 Tax=Corynebacterium pyruviciproducens TaxID=598660 RepID=UPI0023EFFCD2|nr:ImmA/IrrE family metallo-endopeptidase [Corynebacterium pyruviciproducens]